MLYRVVCNDTVIGEFTERCLASDMVRDGYFADRFFGIQSNNYYIVTVEEE